LWSNFTKYTRSTVNENTPSFDAIYPAICNGGTIPTLPTPTNGITEHGIQQ
jgi:hypothetical protein